jgi:hypothetical protein
VSVLRGPAGAFGVAETDAAVTLFSSDLREEEHHFGHGLLPAGEDFGVADGDSEGQPCRGQLDVTNEIYGAHGSPNGYGVLAYT